MRWGLMLQGYNLSIKHIKCNDNCIANVVSRVRKYCDELKQKFLLKSLYPNLFFKRGDAMHK